MKHNTKDTKDTKGEKDREFTSWQTQRLDNVHRFCSTASV
jgi:hypothetical protein